MAVTITIELMGGFRVRVGSRPVAADAWPTRRSSELVQLLALADRFRLAREQAIEALWPHLDPAAGAANLRKAAHHARRALDDPEAVVLRGGVVMLFPGRDVVTDVEAFEREGDPDLYRGELLPEARYEAWAEAARERLRAEYVAALRREGRFERLVEVDPSDEPAVRALMRRELERGSLTGAISWFGRLRSALRRELGASPAAETAALYDLAIARLADAGAAFVGRELETARVKAVLRNEGQTRMIALTGPAGIGKSALIEEIDRFAPDEGWRMIGVSAAESDLPYAPLVALAERLAGQSPRALELCGARARETLELLSDPAEVEPAGRLSRHRVTGALRRLATAATGGERLAIALDDAHLADEATTDALRHLNAGATEPILVLLAYRPEQASPDLRRAVGRHAGAGRLLELELAPLSREEVAALVEASGEARRTRETVDRIVELGQGNPFLSLELARSKVIGVPALSQTAREALIDRFVALDAGATEALERLALAGEGFDPAAATALAGETEAEALARLDAGLRAGVLVVQNARYRFRHELLRQALVEGIAPHRRRALCREAAQALAGVGAEPRLVARQWRQAGEPARAGPWSLDAARRAVRLGAYRDALRDLEQVLGHDPSQPEALRLRAECLDALGDPGAPGAYATAAERAGDGADDLRAKQALAQVKLGDPAGGLDVLAGVEPRSLEGRLAQALAFAGAAALGAGDPAVGSRHAARARRLALEDGDPAAVTVASWAQAAAAHARGELRQNVQADLRDTRGLGRLAVSVFDGQLCMTQRLLYGARPYDDVVRFATSLETEAERLEAARGRAFAVTIRGEAKLLAGRLDEAEADLMRGADLHREIGAATGEAFALQRQAEIRLHRGARGDALALLAEALAIARESDVGFHLFDRIYGTLIEAAPSTDEALAALEEAEDAVRGPIETCPGCRITLAVPAAIAAARGGDTRRASEWAAACEYLANVVMRLPAWDAALEEIRGHLADRPAAAREHFRIAAAGFAACGQPLDQARCAALAQPSAV